MKVLMINAVCGTGSTGRICTDLAHILEEQGHTVKIAYGRQAAPKQFDRYGVRIGSDLGVRVNGVLTRLLDNEGFNAYFATKKFLRWVEEFDPDIVHLHNLHGYYLHIGLLFDYLKRANKKVIWTLHDCWAFTGHCAYFSAAGCDKWQSQCYGCPQKRAYPRSILLSRAKRNFQKKQKLFTGIKDLTLVTPSQWLADRVKESFLKEYAVYPIPNGINLELFCPTENNLREEYGLKNKKILLGVASVWDERKGLNVFVRLSQLLPESYKIVLIGLAEAQQQAMPKEILCFSRTNSIRQLAQWYTTADVFINPSVEETMGMTTAEALACGTPVITYNKTAVPEVADDTCGISVECTPEAIVSALSQLSFTKEACLKRAEAYEQNQQYAQYLKLYQM